MASFRTYIPLLLVPTTVIVACSGQRQPQSVPPLQWQVAPGQTQQQRVAPETTDEAGSSEAIVTEEETEDYDFYYSFPAEANRLFALRYHFEADRAQRRQELLESVAMAKKDSDLCCLPFSMEVSWALVRSLPEWLSLSGGVLGYAGGMRPFRESHALLWDVRAQTARDARDLFISREAYSASVRSEFCDQLDKDRSERRRVPVNRNSGDIFDTCLDPAELLLVLRSSDGKTFTKLVVVVDPYQAGPGVEGGYDQELPVTGKVIAALKTEYQPLFSIDP